MLETKLLPTIRIVGRVASDCVFSRGIGSAKAFRSDYFTADSENRSAFSRAILSLRASCK